MSKAIRASTLVLLFACSVYAGDIQNGSPASPPPANTAGWIQNDSPALPPANADQEPAADGYIQNDAAGTLTEAALFVLGSMLGRL